MSMCHLLKTKICSCNHKIISTSFRNGEVQDIVENGISEANVTVLTDKNVLFVQFVKKLNSTKDEHVSIGKWNNKISHHTHLFINFFKELLREFIILWTVLHMIVKKNIIGWNKKWT